MSEMTECVCNGIKKPLHALHQQWLGQVQGGGLVSRHIDTRVTGGKVMEGKWLR